MCHSRDVLAPLRARVRTWLRPLFSIDAGQSSHGRPPRTAGRCCFRAPLPADTTPRDKVDQSRSGRVAVFRKVCTERPVLLPRALTLGTPVAQEGTVVCTKRSRLPRIVDLIAGRRPYAVCADVRAKSVDCLPAAVRLCGRVLSGVAAGPDRPGARPPVRTRAPAPAPVRGVERPSSCGISLASKLTSPRATATPCASRSSTGSPAAKSPSTRGDARGQQRRAPLDHRPYRTVVEDRARPAASRRARATAAGPRHGGPCGGSTCRWRGPRGRRRRGWRR